MNSILHPIRARRIRHQAWLDLNSAVANAAKIAKEAKDAAEGFRSEVANLRTDFQKLREDQNRLGDAIYGDYQDRLRSLETESQATKLAFATLRDATDNLSTALQEHAADAEGKVTDLMDVVAEFTVNAPKKTAVKKKGQ